MGAFGGPPQPSPNLPIAPTSAPTYQGVLPSFSGGGMFGLPPNLQELIQQYMAGRGLGGGGVPRPPAGPPKPPPPAMPVGMPAAVQPVPAGAAVPQGTIGNVRDRMMRAVMPMLNAPGFGVPDWNKHAEQQAAYDAAYGPKTTIPKLPTWGMS